MASFNRVILVGNLTRDPELRYTPKGLAIAKIGLAVNRTWKNETGESKEEVTFVDIDAFGKQAETIGQYLKKGRSVYVEGRIKTRKYTDKDGVEKYATDIIANEMQMLGGREGAGEPSGGDDEGGGYSRPAAPARPAAAARPAPAAASKPSSGFDDMDDDIPF